MFVFIFCFVNPKRDHETLIFEGCVTISYQFGIDLVINVSLAQ